MSWGPWQILLVLLIVVLLFGTKKLRGMGSDLGSAIKSFKKSMSSEEMSSEEKPDENKTIDSADKHDS